MSADHDFARARRAAACKHFRPMPGMLDLNGWRISAVHAGAIEWSDSEWCSPPTPGRIEPDLRDPATQGCMLTLIAERTGSMSDTLADIAHRMRRGATLPQALVEALESCP